MEKIKQNKELTKPEQNQTKNERICTALSIE